MIECNTIAGNTAHGWGGGGITLWNWYAAYPIGKTVRNNLVVDNTTTAVGGGFYIRYDFSALENNTVADNHAGQRGGGAYVLNQGAGDYPPQLRNWILWGNTAGLSPAIYADASTGSVVYVTYSDVEGGWGGTGNIAQEPQWLGAAYLLNPASPCIDAGNPAVGYNDLCFPPSQGEARNDMGAYGGPAACGWQVDLTAAPPWNPRDDLALLRGSAPNPFRELTRIHFTQRAGGPVRLAIFDISGRRVRELVAGREYAAGDHELEWDGRDGSGRRLRAGVYLARMESAGRVGSQRLVLLP